MHPTYYLSAYIVTLLATSSLALPTPSNTTAVEPRQLTEGLVSWAAAEFETLFGEDASCCEYFNGADCWATAADGSSWQLCYAPGDQVWSAEDAAVANCITNLHYVQNDVCISVAGSECDINGYVESGGRIQNGQLSWWGAYPGSIDSYQSDAIQAGINDLIGTTIRTDSGYGPVFSALSQTNGVDEVDLYFRYIGEDAC